MHRPCSRVRSTRTALSLAGLVLIAAATVPLAAEAQLRRIAIGTNPAGTNYFLVASGLARVLQDETQIPSTVRPFSGSSVYIPMLQRGEIPLGVNTQLDSYVAYSGLDPYPVAMTNLRLLLSLMPLLDNFLVRADAGIETVADLAGHRVITAVRSNVALERWHLGILATGGLGFEDIEALSVASLPDGIRMLTEGRADAAPIGLDTALVRQAHATIPGGVRFVGLGGDESRVLDSVPGARVHVADTASVGIPVPTRVARFDTYLNTGPHISDDDAYLIVRTIHTHWDSLRRDYALLEPITAEMTVPPDSPHPYHPGAVRYWREAGLWTGAHESNQARALAVGER